MDFNTDNRLASKFCMLRVLESLRGEDDDEDNDNEQVLLPCPQLETLFHQWSFP